MRSGVESVGDSRPRWRVQRERGSRWLIHLITATALALGRRFAAAFLPAICAYFVVFSGAARRASREYLGRVFGRPATWREVYRHYSWFANTILDRVFWRAGRIGEYRIEIVGREHVDRILAEGRGALLFGAHFGSFELMHALAQGERGVRVRALMVADHSRNMERILGRIDSSQQTEIIELGRRSTMLEVRDALAAGEMVGLLADRALVHGDDVLCPFFGTPARFPRGPFALARMLGAPIVLFHAIWQGDRRYLVTFDVLRDVDPNAPGFEEQGCRVFAAWLEFACRKAPYNWFNFYDFWWLPNGHA